jgi:hypothetical protein
MSEKHVDLVLTYLQVYEGYHTQKENMAWLATTVYLGAAILLMASDAFWKNWSSPVLCAWLALVLITAAAAFAFVWWQFDRRFKATALLDACTGTVVRWLHDKDRQPDLEPVELPELRIVAPREVVNTFRIDQRCRLHLPLILTLLVLLLWTVAAAISIVARWEGPRIVVQALTVGITFVA